MPSYPLIKWINWWRKYDVCDWFSQKPGTWTQIQRNMELDFVTPSLVIMWGMFTHWIWHGRYIMVTSSPTTITWLGIGLVSIPHDPKRSRLTVKIPVYYTLRMRWTHFTLWTRKKDHQKVLRRVVEVFSIWWSIEITWRFRSIHTPWCRYIYYTIPIIYTLSFILPSHWHIETNRCRRLHATYWRGKIHGLEDNKFSLWGTTR